MKKLILDQKTISEIQRNGEEAYPDEGAGLIFGKDVSGNRTAIEIYPLKNSKNEDSRHNRYLITAKDMLLGETEAEKKGLDVIGIFHSHPDHPAKPSQFDLDWALPWYSYIISSIENGEATISRSWQLKDDRTKFIEEIIEIKK